MNVYFLGTGTSQGIPVIGCDHPVCLSQDSRDKRLRVSVWVHWQNFSLVIDCGPDFRQQMLQSKCPRLDALLFTHEHADHTAGLDDIRPFFFNQGPIPVYASGRVLDNLSRRFDYIFSDVDKYPGAPSVQTHEIFANQSFTLGGKQILPIRVMHGKLEIFGFRIEKMAYLTDVKSLADDQLALLQELDVLVISALRVEPHALHLNLEEALSMIRRIGPKKAYLTHISHLMGFHAEVSSKLPDGVSLAHDNLEITL